MKENFKSGWPGGLPETVSGAGSTAKFTEQLRPMLSQLMRRVGVKRFVDAPCGDFAWMQHVDLDGIDYIGIDIIDEIIANNNSRFAKSGRVFQVADLTNDKLPAGDLIMCRDLILHLPEVNIIQLLRNFADSDFKWILISSYLNVENRDIPIPGAARPVNLTKAPFHFPEPAETDRLPDPPKPTPGRYLFLYDFPSFRRAVSNIGRGP